MKKILIFFSAVLLTAAVQAENLIENANFGKNGPKAPAAWAKIGKGKVIFQSDQGILKLGSLDADTPATCSARQSVFKKLAKGKKYLLSCKVKGDNFQKGSKADYGLMLINKSWKGSAGIRRFKVSEEQPLTIKKVVTVPENWTDAIVVAFIANCTGTLEFSEIKLSEIK